MLFKGFYILALVAILQLKCGGGGGGGGGGICPLWESKSRVRLPPGAHV